MAAIPTRCSLLLEMLKMLRVLRTLK